MPVGGKGLENQESGGSRHRWQRPPCLPYRGGTMSAPGGEPLREAGGVAAIALFI